MHRLCGIVAVCALCSGYMTAQEENAARANSDDRACQSYGAEPGSQAYFQCRMAKDQLRQQNNAAMMRMLMSRPQPTPYLLPVPQQP